ncbi:MAG: SpoIIE family protein phosphatase [Ignavibacteriae bacterium]|nr:SpoIIE family protein phosphatase [Ignavibacteriota bacterium]
MRLLFLFLFSSVMLNAQIILDPVLISADSLTEKPITLSKPWKYSQGDDSTWADKSFDDSSWDTLRPRLEWEKYPADNWTGIGWFRREIKIDSSLYNKSVALSVNHYGASEIYVNSEKIVEYGKVNTIPDSEKVYQPQNIPVAINFTNDTNYVLAVRYSNHASIKEPEWVDSWYGKHGFTMQINNINDEIKNQILNGKTNFGVNFGIGGIFFSLAVLYFLLHLFYSKRKENLYYALFSFSLALLFFSSMMQQLVSTKLIWLIIFKLIAATGIALAFLGYLGFIYSIFYKKIPKQIWFFVSGTIIIGVMFLFSNFRESINYAIPIYIFLATIEGFRSIIIAIKNKKEHSWVIGTGVIVFVILILTIFVINLFSLRPNEISILILFLIGLFGLPASMSVYLARSIASTNLKLEEQIVTVKELSEKQIQQERNNADLKLQSELVEAENKRKTKELEESRELQLSMLPKELPKIPTLDIAVYMKTASEVGGDYYDFHTDIDGTLTVVLGDATGHGMKAGTMVTATKSLFGSYAANKDIIYTFHEMTRCLKQLNFYMLSMCLAMVKINDKNITLSSAGIPPILICRKDENKVEPFVIKGMPLGTIEKFPYKVVESELNEGDTVLIMSDGFPELMNSKKEMYGYNNVIKYFERIANDNPEEIIAELKKEMNTWTDGADPDDDVTFVVLKMK